MRKYNTVYNISARPAVEVHGLWVTGLSLIRYTRFRLGMTAADR